MLNCFQQKISEASLPIHLVSLLEYSRWYQQQSMQIQTWLNETRFIAEAGQFCLLSNTQGQFSGVLLIIANDQEVWEIGALPLQIPEGTYTLAAELPALSLQQAVIAWGLGAYQFTRYKKAKRKPACLTVPSQCHFGLIENIVEATYLVRDLINTPAEDMGPLELAEVAAELGQTFQANVSQIVGEELIEAMYPAIYTVGRAGNGAPRLIDLRWGDPKAPKLTLVGKGVCFDSGGLNLKSSAGMRYMKKDMGGAAHVLGLARMIMQAKLPVRLRVLIPAVENAVSSEAYRPGDVITMRNGKTVEIGNTDAEGRLVLADALVEASSEMPELLIDFATLTGAARIAVGMEIAAMFTNNEALAKGISLFAEQNKDPVWRLPLYAGYLSLLDTPVADINNSNESGYAGAILAALFLQQFIPPDIAWVHFDMSAWNLTTRPGHPEGAEAMALRAVFDYVRQHFSARH